MTYKQLKIYSYRDLLLLTRGMCRGAVALTICVFLFATGCTPPTKSSFPDKTGTLVVDMEGFHSDKGVVVVSLFEGVKGFPDDMDKAVMNRRVNIHSGTAQAVFSGVPYGEYALSALHDEDGDELMKKSLFGTPREGFGFSGRQASMFGPPEFAEAAFLMISETRKVSFRIRYETARREERDRRRLDKTGAP